MTPLHQYFPVDAYTVVSFGASSFVTLTEAADHDRLTDAERTHDRGWSYHPYYELRNEAPEIYASKATRHASKDRWVTFNAGRHAATRYTTDPDYRAGRSWVLLRRRDM
jgi:hypothetical protein